MSTETDIENRLDEWHRIAENSLVAGLPDDQILHSLEQQGIEFSYAETILENARTDIHNRTQFRKTLAYGLGFMVMGLLLNILSYITADRWHLNFFLLFWGIVVTGFGFIARAFILFRK